MDGLVGSLISLCREPVFSRSVAAVTFLLQWPPKVHTIHFTQQYPRATFIVLTGSCRDDLMRVLVPLAQLFRAAHDVCDGRSWASDNRPRHFRSHAGPSAR
jgi:hypothetical protein